MKRIIFFFVYVCILSTSTSEVLLVDTHDLMIDVCNNILFAYFHELHI